MPEIISSKQRKARKVHECIWCGELIEKGESYYSDVVNYDGTLQTQKYHKECYDAVTEYFKVNNWIDEFEPFSFKRGSTDMTII